MILFASGRCDICGYYSEWLMNRIHEGYVDVRNPFDLHQISRISLDETQVDCLLLCTKNPIPILQYLDELKKFCLLFHVTITAYHEDVEKNVKDKKKILQAVHELSVQLGKEHIVLRYDPILLNDRYTIDYHTKAFEKICAEMKEDVSKIIISFVDMYKNTRMHAKELNMQELSEAQMHEIGKRFGKIAQKYSIQVQTCAEKIDLTRYGILSGNCVDQEEIETLCGHAIAARKGVRKECSCIETVDIGDYNCCGHGCKYCYANYDESSIGLRMKEHDPQSSVLIGHISKEDKIHVRRSKSIHQLRII